MRLGRPSPAVVVDAAADLLGVTAEELRGRGKWKPLTEYRRAAVLAAAEATGYSAPRLADFFGHGHCMVRDARRYATDEQRFWAQMIAAEALRRWQSDDADAAPQRLDA